MYAHLALSENGFLFDGRTGSTFSLNRTATFLLRRIIDGVAPEVLSGMLEDTFDVESTTARRDVEQFLYRLKDLSLTQVEEEA